MWIIQDPLIIIYIRITTWVIMWSHYIHICIQCITCDYITYIHVYNASHEWSCDDHVITLQEESQALQSLTMFSILTAVHKEYRTILELERCVKTADVAAKNELVKRITKLKITLVSVIASQPIFKNTPGNYNSTLYISGN